MHTLCVYIFPPFSFILIKVYLREFYLNQIANSYCDLPSEEMLSIGLVQLNKLLLDHTTMTLDRCGVKDDVTRRKWLQA